MNTQGLTIENLQDKALDLQQFKADYIAPVADFTFDDQARMVLRGDFVSSPVDILAVPTDHALSQLLAKLGIAAFGKSGRGLPAEFMRAIPKDWCALNLNEAIKRMPERSGWTMRTFQDTTMEAASARAVMDKDYYDFDNADMLEIIAKVLTDKPVEYRISPQSFVHADAMRVDVIMGYKKTKPDGGGNEEWMWGAGLKNDEIGRGGGSAFQVIKRGKCDNSIVIDIEGYNYAFRHWARLNKTRVRYKTEMAVAIGNILPHAEEMIEEILKASYEELPDFSRMVQGCSIVNGWDDKLVGHIWEGAEGLYTRGGLINGVTHAAKFAETLEARFEMETFGGAILVTPDSVFSNAESAMVKVERENEREQKREARLEARPQRRNVRR